MVSLLVMTRRSENREEMVLESVVQYTVLELLLLVVYFENLSKNESVDDDGWQYEGCSSVRKAIQILLYSKSYTFVWCTICAAVTTVMASLVAIGRHRRRQLQASPFMPATEHETLGRKAGAVFWLRWRKDARKILQNHQHRHHALQMKTYGLLLRRFPERSIRVNGFYDRNDNFGGEKTGAKNC